MSISGKKKERSSHYERQEEPSASLCLSIRGAGRGGGIDSVRARSSHYELIPLCLSPYAVIRPHLVSSPYSNSAPQNDRDSMEQ